MRVVYGSGTDVVLNDGWVTRSARCSSCSSSSSWSTFCDGEILFLAVDCTIILFYYKCINYIILLIIQSRSCQASLRSGPFSRSVPVVVVVVVVVLADPDPPRSRSTQRSASPTRMRSSLFSSPSNSASTLPSTFSPFHTTPISPPLHSLSPPMSPLTLPPSPSSHPSTSA